MHTKRKKAGRLLALLLSMAMVLSLVPGIAMADEQEDAGGQESVPKTLADVVAEGHDEGSDGYYDWVLDSDGTLDISGTGYVTYNPASDASWYPYREQIINVIFEEGVGGVAQYGFYGYTNLETVILPSTCERIYSYAFQNCTSLRSINCGGTKQFNSYVFSGCSSLTDVTIDSATTLSANSFEYCTSLESIVIPDSCTTLANYVFRGCTSLKTVTIGSGLTQVGGSSSSGTLGAYAFQDCPDLEYVTFLASGTSLTLGYCGFKLANYTENCDLNVVFLNTTKTSAPSTASSSTNAPFYGRDNVNIYYPCNLSWSISSTFGGATNAVGALSHDWGDATFNWSSDYASATATATCTKCSTEETTENVEVWITNEEGYYWYNALATFSNGVQFSDRVQGEAAVADKTELEETIAYADSLNYRDYTQDTWSAMQTVLRSANRIDQDEDAYQEDVDYYTEQLWDAINALEPFYEADRTVLDALIEYAAKLSEDDYSADSWAAFDDALTAAEALADDTSDDSYFASQEEVDEATEALWDAMDALVREIKIDKAVLDATIEHVGELDPDIYTDESWSALETALADAQSVSASTTATQEDVDNATEALLEAIYNLKAKDAEEVDKSALEALIAAEGKLNQCDYTADSWSNLMTALDAAVQVSEDDGATQDAVNKAASDLQDAIGSLETSLWDGHDWIALTDDDWTWSSDSRSAAVSRTCDRCGITETVLAAVEETASVAPTCTDAGEITYTATASFSEETEPVTAENSVEVPATGHTWGEITFTWNEDDTDATATRQCTVCGTYDDTVTVTMDSQEVPATCTEGGETVCVATAECEDGTTAAEYRFVTTDPLGHTWGGAEWTWSADYSTAFATRTCGVCGMEEVAKAAVTSEVVSEPTATQTGQTRYTAEAAFSDTTETDTVTATVPALGEADKTALDVAIAAANALDSSSYTSASWADLQTALNSAQKVKDDPEASLADVDAAAQAVQNAISSLVKSSTSSNPSNTDKTGFVQESGEWHYYNSDGKQFTGNDIKEDTKKAIDGTDGWYYIVNGKVDFSYTGVSHFANDYGWWYVKNGKVDFSKNSVEQNQYGWWYVLGGKVDFSYTGVSNYSNAYGWWYIEKGKVNFGKTSIEPNNYGWWRVVSGKVDFSCNSVEQNDYGWWYVTGGKVQFGYTGVSDYGNAYGYWYIKAGKVDFSKNSVEQNSYGWWYVVGGKVQFGYTGVANYANASGWWYIRSGKVDFGYTGTASNNYGTWNVVNGKVVF